MIHLEDGSSQATSLPSASTTPAGPGTTRPFMTAPGEVLWEMTIHILWEYTFRMFMMSEGG